MKRNVFIIVVLFCVIGQLTTNVTTAQKDASVTTSNADSWPMFGHDINHSRVSFSTAPKNNTVLWKSPLGLSVKSSPAIVGGRVYIGATLYVNGSLKGMLACLNITDGVLLWSYVIENQHSSDIQSSPAVYHDKVYFGTIDNKMYCLDAITGAFIWKYTLPSQVFSSPAIVDDKVYVNSDGIYCFDATGNGDGTTTLLWHTDMSHGDSSPAIYDGKVYAGSNDRQFICLNANTGEQLWWYKPQSAIFIPSSPTVVNDRVYFGGIESGFLYCVDADPSDGIDEGISDDGQVGEGFDLIWIAETLGALMSSPAAANGKVYVGSYDHSIYCFDALSGNQLWQYETGGVVVSSPAIADGKLFIGSNDGGIYCVEIESGELLWMYQSEGMVVSCPAVANGLMVIGSYDGNVYAFGQVDSDVPDPPHMRFGSIHGGRALYIEIQNLGEETAETVQLNVTYTKRWLLGPYMFPDETFLDMLPAGQSHTFRYARFLGFGFTTMTIQVSAQNAADYEESLRVFLFGSLLYVCTGDT